LLPSNAKALQVTQSTNAYQRPGPASSFLHTQQDSLASCQSFSIDNWTLDGRRVAAFRLAVRCWYQNVNQ